MNNPSCPACPGVGRYLGALGNLEHFRCESCGTTFSDKSIDMDADAEEFGEPNPSAGRCDQPDLERDVRVSDYYAGSLGDFNDY
jgi:NAD-dependent SIR2 family protein deacetylase